MSAFLTLTRREIADRSTLLWGTLATALIPIVARLLPWLRPALRQELHESLAAIFGIAFPLALALGLGASVVGEDLAHRRLGFYFSRPVNGWTIWASKTLAAAFVTLLAWVSFVLPVFLLSGERFLAQADAEWFLPWTAVLLGLIVLAQAVAGAYRARDGLFALDIVAVAILVSLGAGLAWRLHAAGASTLAWMAVPAMVVVALAAAMAGAMQVVVGRTDARRGHLALSACLWGTLAAGLLAAAAFSAWVLSVAPQDAGALPWSVRATASGSHLAFLAARPRFGYQPLFLLDTETGRFDRLPAGRMLGDLAFSRDGRRVVWIEENEPPELLLRRLDTAGSSVIRSTLRGYVHPRLVGLSDDGRQAVLATRAGIMVVDTDSGREAASASLTQLGVPEPRGHALLSRWTFVGDLAIGIFCYFVPPGAGPPLVISTLDFRTGRVEAGPRVGGVDRVRDVADGRALVSGRNALAIVDRSEVRLLVTTESEAIVGSAAFLADGRAAALVARGGDRRLMVWSSDGQRSLDVPFPAGVSLVSGEPRSGWLALASGFSLAPRTVFVDLATGAVVREVEGLTPTGAGHENDRAPALPAGSPGARLFADTKGGVVRLDPETGRPEATLVSPLPEGAP